MASAPPRRPVSPAHIESQIEHFLEQFRIAQSAYMESQQTQQQQHQLQQQHHVMFDIASTDTTSSDDNVDNLVLNCLNGGTSVGGGGTSVALKDGDRSCLADCRGGVVSYGIDWSGSGGGQAAGSEVPRPELLQLISKDTSTSPSSDYVSSTSSFNSLGDTDDNDNNVNSPSEAQQHDVRPRSNPGKVGKCAEKKFVDIANTSQEKGSNVQVKRDIKLHQSADDISNLDKLQQCEQQGEHERKSSPRDSLISESVKSLSICSSLCESDYKSVRSVYSESEFKSLKSSYWSLNGSFSSLLSIHRDVFDWKSITMATTDDTYPLDDDRHSFNIVNFNYVMGDSACRLTILDVADVLQARHAYVSGGRGEGGSALLTFPDCHNISDITEEQYRNLVTYLISIPSLEERDAGFSVLIDRRKDKWSAVKSVLNKMAAYFPATLVCVYVLKPSGFLQKTFGNIGTNNLKDNYKFKVVMCTGIDDLTKEVSRDELTAELGGTLFYDHKDWVNQRAAVEKFSANTSRLGENLKHWCKKLQQLEFPNDVESTTKLIHEHEVAHNEISEDLESTLKHGDILLTCFKTIHDAEGQEQTIETASLPVCKLVHVTAVERLVSQLEETQVNFQEFWLKHEKKLAQCLQLRQFEDDFKNLHVVVVDHADMISKMTDSGDTLQQVTTLYDQLRQFEQNTETDVTQAETLVENGQDFINNDHYAVDCIRPKCIELQRVCSQYRELMRQRRELLKKSEELHTRLEQANTWCENGISLLATQQLHSFNTSEGAQHALADVDLFLSTSGEFSLGDFDQLHDQYEPVISPTQKITLEDTLKKVDNVHDLCEKRRNSLQKLMHRSKQTVIVQPQPTRKEPVRISPQSHDKKRYSTSSSGSTDSDKQGHVIRELIETERTYVYELRSIIDGYKSAMEQQSSPHGGSPSSPHTQGIPTALRGQSHILFGNLEEIWGFHEHVFMKELDACSHDPASVGKCFVRQQENFSIYSEYCRNKPASEALICEIGDNNPFFKECQSKLGHKLPLSAYLLKPVQRITKYQLLLKEMLKYTHTISLQQELQEAISSMVTVLRYVNDVMHATAIMGFPGRLSQQGKLLLQDSFSLCYQNQRDKTMIRDQLRGPKVQQRHVFVYENVIIFCKKREENSRGHGHASMASGYVYKSHFQTSAIGLTENVKGSKGDRRKFEIWKGHKRTEAEIYTLTASSVEVKDMWVREIKKVLLTQFDGIKERLRRDVSTVPIRHMLEHSPSVSSPTGKVGPAVADDNMFTTNNNNTVSEGEEIVRAATVRPLSAIASHDQGGNGNLATEIPYDDTSWSSSDGYPDTFPDFSMPENVQGVCKFYTALADYNAMGPSEVTMRETDVVEVLQVGHQGWWFVRHLGTEQEGWVPASYLEAAKRRSTMSSSHSIQSTHSSHSLHTSQSSGSFGKELLSATDV